MLNRALFAAILLLLAGCDDAFEPLASSELVFSVYGHLDAAADTQWVRVMPLRESLFTTSGPIDAVVTLEEVETGTSVVMRDSLFRYRSPLLPDADLYAHNFWTTMALTPGRHYRVTASRSDGATASATVLIPIFQSPALQITNRFRFPSFPNDTRMATTFGTISGTRYLGMVLGRENVPGRCNWPLTIHQQLLPILDPAASEGGNHGVQLAWSLDPEEGSRPAYVAAPPLGNDVVDDLGIPRGGLCALEPKRIVAIASGGPWQHAPDTELRELTHPAAVDNIEGHGLGFLAGVHTYVFPYAGCIPIQRASACSITFDARSATLAGVVTNECTGGPLPDVRVRLTAPATNALRYDTTDVSGHFQFQGMEPGALHSLLLAQRIAPGDFVPLELENVSVGEAAVDTVAVEMAHRRDCEA